MKSGVPSLRSERLVAYGRVVLAVTSFVAIWLDPSEPTRHAHAAYVALACYSVYSILVAVAVWRTELPFRHLPLLTHVLDLLSFSLFMYLTEGPTSPFFLYFVFALLGAMLRWEWRGTMITGAAALAIFLAMGLWATEVLRDPRFEPYRFIVRSIYLCVMTALIASVGGHEQRLRGELGRLASWSPQIVTDLGALVRDSLARVADILVARCVVMVWEEAEEPWADVASWSETSLDLAREATGEGDPFVDEALSACDFVWTAKKREQPSVLLEGTGGLESWRGNAFTSGFFTRFPCRGAVVLRLRGESGTGRLFVLDSANNTPDGLVLGRVVARQLAAHLDQLYLLQHIERSSVASERLRLARELHDGVLQSLTGAALQLQAVERAAESDPDGALAALPDVQDFLLAEQRELRFFVDELGPPGPSPPPAKAPLRERLEELAERMERLWGIPVALELESSGVRSAEALAGDVYRIVREALVNVGRHAGATRAAVSVKATDRRVLIAVSDDGHGFSFTGRFDDAALAASKLGPVSLKARVASLGGLLAIESAASGARVEVSLPVPDWAG